MGVNVQGKNFTGDGGPGPCLCSPVRCSPVSGIFLYPPPPPPPPHPRVSSALQLSNVYLLCVLDMQIFCNWSWACKTAKGCKNGHLTL